MARAINALAALRKKMIDFHTHILFGLDDGANNVDESLELIKSLKEQGVDKIVLTPHYYFNNMPEEGFFILRERNLKTLKEAVQSRGIDVKLYPACEVYLSKTGLTENIAKYNIRGTRYIMLELPHRTSFNKGIFDKITNIMNYTGLVPVIAHAERYPAVLSKPELISQLILMGCLIQINTTSLFSGRLKRLAFKMLKMGQVHCLGTDCHNVGRPPIYREAAELIKKTFGEECFGRLQQNMEDILSDKTITVDKVKPIKKIFGFYY